MLLKQHLQLPAPAAAIEQIQARFTLSQILHNPRSWLSRNEPCPIDKEASIMLSGKLAVFYCCMKHQRDGASKWTSYGTQRRLCVRFSKPSFVKICCCRLTDSYFHSSQVTSFTHALRPSGFEAFGMCVLLCSLLCCQFRGSNRTAALGNPTSCLPTR